MARDKGTYNMPGNIELRKEAPLDARRKVNTFAELFLEDTWKDSNNRVWLYDGMTVEVGDRLGELWQLKSKTSYSNPEDWIRISGGIEDAPKDGTPYMRQDGKWKGYTQIEEVYTFTPSATDNTVTQEDYDGLKAAIEAGKVIVYSMAVYTRYFISNSSTITDGTITISFNIDYSCVVITIGSDLTYSETSKTFIAKDNTDVYSVTNDYNPAHKKYVDDINFGKVINGSSEILIDCNLTETEAETKIATLFGSIDAFKNCVRDMADNHTKYFYTWENNIVDICSVVWMSTDKNNYELYFTFNYPNLTHFSNKRVVIRYTVSSSTPTTIIIQEISTDDRLKEKFADITQSPEQDLNNITGNGIMTNTQNAFATTERNYPIDEAGALFYGVGAYGRTNQIYGGFSSNRWFARGGGNANYTPWREYIFKDDMAIPLSANSNLNDFKTFGIYRQSNTGTLNTVTNKPSGEVGEAVLQVYECGSNYTVQVYYNITTEQAFIRFNHSGTWSDWHVYTGIEQNYIGSGSIDNITAAGEYVIGPDVTNDPFTDYCWLKVMGLSDIVQIVIRYSTLEIAIRSKVNGSWSSWKYVTTSDNLSIITKVTTAQYNASNKAANTAYFVTD